jgi:hypothetical protein
MRQQIKTTFPPPFEKEVFKTQEPHQYIAPLGGVIAPIPYSTLSQPWCSPHPWWHTAKIAQNKETHKFNYLAHTVQNLHSVIWKPKPEEAHPQQSCPEHTYLKKLSAATPSWDLYKHIRPESILQHFWHHLSTQDHHIKPNNLKTDQNVLSCLPQCLYR